MFPFFSVLIRTNVPLQIALLFDRRLRCVQQLNFLYKFFIYFLIVKWSKKT